MTYLQYAEKLDVVKHLAECKRAGTPDQLAKKLHVSERTVQRMVQQLRKLGFPITYNRIRCTYEIKIEKN